MLFLLKRLCVVLCVVFCAVTSAHASVDKKKRVFLTGVDVQDFSWEQVEAHLKKSDRVPAKLKSLFITQGRCERLPLWIIDKMPNLTALSMVGVHLSFVPEDIVNLAKLRSLTLTGNSFRSVPVPIFGMTQLTKLNLRANGLMGVDARIGNLTNLKSLNFEDNNIKKLPGSLAKLKRLKTLALSGNKDIDLSFDLKSLENLKMLELRSCGFETAPKALKDLPAGATVDLRNNPILSRAEAKGEWGKKELIAALGAHRVIVD